MNEIMSIEDYKFNPLAIVVNENSANYSRIKEVIALRLMASKAAGCQMHFKKISIRV